MPTATTGRSTGSATGATPAVIRHPAAWWAAGRLELHWAGRKRIATAIDGATRQTAVTRVWQIVSGTVVVEHQGRRWRARPGDWLVLPGALKRQYLPSGTVVRSLGASWRDADGRQPLAGLPPWLVPPASHRRLERAVDAVEDWIERHGTGWPDAAAAKSANQEVVDAATYGRLQAVLHDLLGVLLADVVLARSPADAAIERALACLRANAAGAYPGTPAVAATAGLGTRRLEQRFTQAVGLPPRAWHNRLRLDEACRRLAGPEAPLKHIAHELGFSGAPACRRWFRSAMGCAPSTWRRRHLGS